MRSVFTRETARSIRGSLGRFLAIMGITAMGCGFFAGLQMSGPDMRAASDRWYDGTNLYDVRVVSTLGFADEDVETLAAVEGAEEAMGSVTCDFMARLGGEQLAVRVSSFDVEAARAASTPTAWQVDSDAEGYLNRLTLLTGTWPEGEDECVLEGDKELPGVEVGDVVEVLYGTRDVDDVLRVRELTVVGLVSSPNYPYTGSFGSTTLGSGMIGAYLYVGEDTLADDCPCTEVYLTISGAAAEESESDAYFDVVKPVEKRIEDMAPDLAAARLASLRASSQEAVDEGRAELEEQTASAEAQLEQLAARVDELSADVARLEAQEAGAGSRSEQLEAHLETMRQALAEAEAAYETARTQADEQLSAAQAELDEAQAEVDALELPDVYVLDRSQNEGCATYLADSERMDSLADVFPAMFFLVAALISLTTMTRMVEDERIVIGTHKALGYSKARIASRYLVYAVVASAVGAVAGILALSQVLPFIITSSYGIIYAVPLFDFPLPIFLGTALVAGGLGVGVTVFATLVAVMASLRAAPAQLMVPRAPKAGKRILLEHVGPLWRRLSFSWKVTCRNIFRYKRRLLMTVFGVAGCTALLLVGFGLHDSIWDIIDNQYGPIIHYDTTVGLSEEASEDDVEAVVGYLESMGDVNGIVRVQSDNMRAGADGYDGTKLLVSVVTPEDDAALADAVTFKNRLSGEAVAFGPGAVLVSEKLSMTLGIGVGNEVLLYDQDDVGNAVGEGHRLEVTGVVENYVGNYVYLGDEARAALGEGEPLYGTIYCSVNDDDQVRGDLSEALEEMDNVSTVLYTSETIDLYRSMLSVVDLVTVVLIVCAAALAFIVLYNLTNINVSERVREIASLKVLGFTRKEVYAYVFREILILAVAGDALGMVLGSWLENFVIVTAEVDYVMFGRTIHPASYCYAFALTIVFSVLAVRFMRKKLDGVNMVESLKSVD